MKLTRFDEFDISRHDRVARVAAALYPAGLTVIHFHSGTDVFSVGGEGIARYHYVCPDQGVELWSSGVPYRLISDVRSDAEMAANPVVKHDASIKSALWVPVINEAGHTLGAIVCFNPTIDAKVSISRTASLIGELAYLLANRWMVKFGMEETRSLPPPRIFPTIVTDQEGHPVCWTKSAEALITTEVGTYSDEKVRQLASLATQTFEEMPCASYSGHRFLKRELSQGGACYSLKMPGPDSSRFMCMIFDSVSELQSPPGFADAPAAPMDDDAPGRGTDGLPLTQFLLDTLVLSSHLVGRNDVKFVALRRWRKSIQKHQLSAFKALKLTDAPNLAQSAAAEIVDEMRRHAGFSGETSVVPIPGGHSGRSNSLSVQIARQVAIMTNSHFENVLEFRRLKGSSHPKNSAQLKPYRITATPRGKVFLIDDIATSGRHIELAAGQLRNLGCDVSAYVWLNGNS